MKFSLFLGSCTEKIDGKCPSSIYRHKFRLGQSYLQSTSGLCSNFVQANVAILPAEFAADFKKFVDLNSAPCPLLYMSENGEYKAPMLADDVDIRYYTRLSK